MVNGKALPRRRVVARGAAGTAPGVAPRGASAARRSGAGGLLLGIVAAALLLAGGCRGGTAADTTSAAGETEDPRELVIFVYDRSTSIPNHSLALAQTLVNQRIDALEHGDRIAALQLLQLSLAEPPKRWSQSVPEREWENREISRDSIARARFVQDAKAYLRGFADTTGRQHIDGTDILSTLHDVAAELRAYPDHRATLYLFSDMLQSNRTIDMEGLRRMPSPDYVAEASAEGKLPDLTGLCVVVVGARVDTDAAQRVKRFWSEYFEVTGARLLDENYMLRPVRLPLDPCGSGG